MELTEEHDRSVISAFAEIKASAEAVEQAFQGWFKITMLVSLLCLAPIVIGALHAAYSAWVSQPGWGATFSSTSDQQSVLSQRSEGGLSDGH
jgi:hypothetical protein